MPRRRAWHPSKYDLVTLAGVGMVFWQSVQHTADGHASDSTLVYAGLAMIAAGLGLRFDQRNGGVK